MARSSDFSRASCDRRRGRLELENFSWDQPLNFLWPPGLHFAERCSGSKGRDTVELETPGLTAPCDFALIDFFSTLKLFSTLNCFSKFGHRLFLHPYRLLSTLMFGVLVANATWVHPPPGNHFFVRSSPLLLSAGCMFFCPWWVFSTSLYIVGVKLTPGEVPA